MNSAQLNKLTGLALDIAIEAAALALDGSDIPTDFTKRGGADLVTQCDTASERLVRQRLAERTPQVAIVGKTQSGTPNGPSWYCDSTAATTNRVRGHPFFCVSIGMMDAGEPLLGAVVAPALRLHWAGYRGGSARRNGLTCQVSSTQVLSGALIATGFHPQVLACPNDSHPASFRNVLASGVHGVRICGSTALDLCLVADGTYDAYWERRLDPWDAVAGAAILLSAGGRITDLKGGRPDLRVGPVLCSNGALHEPLLTVV